MRYLAIMLLSIVALSEFVLRYVMLMVFVLTVFGFLLLVIIIDDSDDLNSIIKPVTFDLVQKLVDEGPGQNREMRRLQTQIDNLNRDKDELQSLLVAHDARGG